MSQTPSGVSILFTPDRSEVDAALADLRSKPVEIQVKLKVEGGTPTTEATDPAAQAKAALTADTPGLTKPTAGVTPASAGLEAVAPSQQIVTAMQAVAAAIQQSANQFASTVREQGRTPEHPESRDVSLSGSQPGPEGVSPKESGLATSAISQQTITAMQSAVASLQQAASQVSSAARQQGQKQQDQQNQPSQTPSGSAQGVVAQGRVADGAGNSASGDLRNAAAALIQAATRQERAANAGERSARTLAQATESPEAELPPSAPAGGNRGGAQRFAGLRTSGLARYIGLGFLAREALAVGTGYQQDQLQADLAERRGDPFAGVQRETGVVNAISRIPIFGQAASFLIGATGSEIKDAAIAEQDARQSLIREGGFRQQGVARLEFQTQTSGFNRERERYDDRDFLPQSFEQRSQDFLRTADRERSQRRVHVASLNQQIQQARAEGRNAEADALHGLLHEEETSGEEAFQSRQQLLRRQAGEVIRQRELRINSLNRRGPELQAAEQGNFGIAESRSFFRELDDSQAEANEQSPLIGFIVGLQNFARRRARGQLQGLRTGRVQSSTQSVNALLADQPLSAQLIDINSDQTQALAGALSTQEQDAIRANTQARIQLTVRNFNRQTELSRFGLQAADRQVLIQSGLTRESQGQSPQLRSALGEVQGVVDQIQQQRFEAHIAGRDTLIPDIAKLGKDRLIGLRDRLSQSIEGVEVDPFLQSLNGVGTFDLGAANRAIKRGLQAIDTQGNDIPGVPGGQGGNAGGGNNDSNTPVAQNTSDTARTLHDIYSQLLNFASIIKVA